MADADTAAPRSFRVTVGTKMIADPEKFHKKGNHCDPSRHLQESPGPPGPKSQKSLKKGIFGGLEKSLEKYPKKSKNIDFQTFLGIF